MSSGEGRRLVREIPVTSVAQRTSPPGVAFTSAATVVATSWKSTTPVPGTHKARVQATCGSFSRSWAGSISSTPGTPFSSERRWSSSSLGSSSSVTATTALPHSVTGISCSSQKASISSRPCTQRRAFSDPGA